MDRYFTIMIVPEREKGVRSFRIPRFMFFSLSVLAALITVFLLVLGYDYVKILQQVYKNKHLTIENRQLKEQIQLFQMKINALSDDIERVNIFEKKLRIITGAPSPLSERKQQFNKIKEDFNNPETKLPEGQTQTNYSESASEPMLLSSKDYKQITRTSEFKEIKSQYDQKIAFTFGLEGSYTLTKNWTDLIQESFELSNTFAIFDTKYKFLKQDVSNLEQDIHQLDSFLLNKDSFLKSTPSIFPTKGWITSYYGPRKSPMSGRVKMHEGIDIGARPGTGIVAPADGIVVYAGKKPGFGHYVQLDHGYGVETIFGHAKRVLTKSGKKIKRGALIAEVGNSGYSTGPHLHYEIRVNGIPVDPMYFVLD